MNFSPSCSSLPLLFCPLSLLSFSLNFFSSLINTILVRICSRRRNYESTKRAITFSFRCCNLFFSSLHCSSDNFPSDLNFPFCTSFSHSQRNSHSLFSLSLPLTGSYFVFITWTPNCVRDILGSTDGSNYTG